MLKSSKHVDEKTAKHLLPNDNMKTPNFYLLPKVHKELIPGRPVINSSNCHTTCISDYVSHVLQPEVESLPSYVKDTTDFIKKVEGKKVPERSYLVTLDVKALYTNIPHDEGIKAATAKLTQSGHRSKEVFTIESLLTLILTLNNFIFNEEHFLQISGCAMGTKCAPPYANLFMGDFEMKHIYPLIHHFSQSYIRYIDDIFMIWTGTEDQFQAFVRILNQSHPSIKFDYKIAQRQIEFLDTVVFIDDDNIVKTKVYTKPTDRKNFLHRQSEHPEALKKSLPYSQALRGRRISSNQKDFEDFCLSLTNAFVKRGYKEEEIIPSIERARNTDRASTLKNSNRDKKTDCLFITTYNRTLPNVNLTLKKHWHLLKLDPVMSRFFEKPPMIAFKRNKNIGDILSSKLIKDNQVERKLGNRKGKCSPCDPTKKMKCCKQIEETMEFQSYNTSRKFAIFHD